MYSQKQLEAMDAKNIAECSQKHIESVIEELIETSIAALASSATTEPADLSKAILAIPDGSLFDPDVDYNSWEKGLYYRGFRDARGAAAALAKQVPVQEQDKALTILREFVQVSVEHDVGGGDLVVTTCEVLEKARTLVDSMRDPSMGVCGVKPAECPDHARCGCEKRVAAKNTQSADK